VLRLRTVSTASAALLLPTVALTALSALTALTALTAATALRLATGSLLGRELHGEPLGE